MKVMTMYWSGPGGTVRICASKKNKIMSKITEVGNILFSHKNISLARLFFNVYTGYLGHEYIVITLQ